jgi:mannitol/fructose-specific phosphotransferase system IIA component (Ntr-type)
MNEEQINKKFNSLIEKLNDNQFWEYIRSWLSEDFVCDIMNDWETETKKDAIKELNKILKKSEPTQI